MPVLNSYFDDQKIILTADFYSTVSNRNFRAFHSHNCVEMAYVSLGTADQILMFPDGRKETQKLSKGNYVIIDPKARHAYRNGSDDFTVINLLFKPSFLFHPANRDTGTPERHAFSVTRSKWNRRKDANGVELKFELEEPQPVKDQHYLRLWMDLRGDGTEIDFSEARVGLIINGDVSAPYVPDKGLPFYFMGEGDDHWITLKHGKNGYFGANNGTSVKGWRGWFAFPIGEMCQHKAEKSLIEGDLITGVYFYYSVKEKVMAGKHLYLDDFILVEDYRRSTKKVLCDDRLINFEEGVLEITVTGKNGSTELDAHLEQIKISVLEEQDFYELVKKAYPHFDYEKVSSPTMNQVYFDRDGNLLPLFKTCYTCSREHWQEWDQVVRNSLSLIVMLSLRSMTTDEGGGKKDIIDIVRNYVDANYAEDITLNEICEKHFYNVSYVCRKFKKSFHCSFEQYLRQVRVAKAGELLLSTSLSVAEVAESCGYTSIGAFRKAFMQVTGKKPVEFKRKYCK